MPVSNLDFVLLSSPSTNTEKQFLYNLLATRKNSISHFVLPDFQDHCFFVDHHPYHSWYLIYISHQPIGSLYLALDNSVGLHVLPSHSSFLSSILVEFSHRFSPLQGVKSVRSQSFFFNVSPSNEALSAALVKAGYIISQVSYILIDPTKG